MVIFLKSLLHQFTIVKIVHLQNETFIYYLDGYYFLYTSVSRTIILDFRLLEVCVRYHSGGSMKLNARILHLAYMLYL